MAVKAKPDGYHAVTPYLVVDGAARLIDFLEEVFDAQEVERLAAPGGRIGHAELRIGDSVVMLGDAHGEHKPLQTMLYVYVDDADAIYQRALAAGATSVQAPVDQFYGDRSGGVKDAFGNLWWIATHIEDVPPAELKRRAEAAMEKARPAATDAPGHLVERGPRVLRMIRRAKPISSQYCTACRGAQCGVTASSHAVLRCGSTAGPDSADQLAVHHDREATLGRHAVRQREQTERGRRAAVDRIGEQLVRTPEQRGGACLRLRDLDRMRTVCCRWWHARQAGRPARPPRSPSSSCASSPPPRRP